jgi:hypothetical protein
MFLVIGFGRVLKSYLKAIFRSMELVLANGIWTWGGLPLGCKFRRHAERMSARGRE